MLAVGCHSNWSNKRQVGRAYAHRPALYASDECHAVLNPERQMIYRRHASAK